LVAVFEIDNPKTNRPERDRLRLIDPLLIGASMSQGESRSPDASRFGSTLVVCIPGYPAQIPVHPYDLSLTAQCPIFIFFGLLVENYITELRKLGIDTRNVRIATKRRDLGADDAGVPRQFWLTGL
jgi:hypothetical protein